MVLWWSVGSVLMGCTVPPRHVESEIEVDGYLAQRAYASACVGLQNRNNDGLRTYTAQQLVRLPSERVANDCLCAALYDPLKHVVDGATAMGLAGSKRNELAKCLAPSLIDPLVEDRPRVAALLAGIDAEAGYQALEDVTNSGEGPEIRAAATRGLLYSSRAQDRLAELVLQDEDPGVRAAAAEALAGRKDPKIVQTIKQVLAEEQVVEVRAAALRALVTSDAAGSRDLVCKTLMEDEDARMRIGAANAFRKSEDRLAIDCLKRRLLEEELNPAVRTEVMEAIESSPTKHASNALCALIAPMMKLYVKDVIAEETPGVDIIKFQNNKDWERSYECVERALQSPGLSCYAKNHLGKWMRELGGKAARPLCPGMKRLPSGD